MVRRLLHGRRVALSRPHRIVGLGKRHASAVAQLAARGRNVDENDRPEMDESREMERSDRATSSVSRAVDIHLNLDLELESSRLRVVALGES